MHEKSKTKTRASIALALCFCVVALTSFLAVKSSLDKINDIGTAASDTQTPVSGNQEASAKTPVVDSQENSTPEAEEKRETSGASQDSAEYIMPVNGTVQLKYSMDSLVYSKTLDQYMTHPGIDLEAPSGSSVNAIADGTVTAVYEDDAYGTAIEITHADGLMSKYACLETAALIEEGDTVSQGQQISTIGKTALYESLDPAHLHFEMYKDGQLCNPADYITFE